MEAVAAAETTAIVIRRDLNDALAEDVHSIAVTDVCIA